MQSQSLVNKVILESGNTWTKTIVSYVAGLLLLTATAQVVIALPWTPVPITGQTFGVLLLALLWGKEKSFKIVASYLIMGALGLPVFALSLSGITFGATFGYLLGMLLSTVVVGHWADRQGSSSFYKACAAATVGTLVVFMTGLLWLSLYVPQELLLSAGLWPFLPGALVKIIAAAGVGSTLAKLKS